MQLSSELNQLCYRIIGVCMEVHREIGPGSPEEYYQKALEIEFAAQGFRFEPQKPVPVLYKGTQIGMNFIDFVIENQVILEIKSVQKLDNVTLFQTLKYLAWTTYPLALLVNFGLSLSKPSKPTCAKSCLVSWFRYAGFDKLNPPLRGYSTTDATRLDQRSSP